MGHLIFSYNRMGDLMLSLSQGEQARLYFQKALDIRERLVAQEPEYVVRRTDLVVSLVRMGDRESLQRALDIARQLEEEKKLNADQAGWVEALETAIRDTENDG